VKWATLVVRHLKTSLKTRTCDSRLVSFIRGGSARAVLQSVTAETRDFIGLQYAIRNTSSYKVLFNLSKKMDEEQKVVRKGGLAELIAVQS
jgi:hypothetical protein